MNNYVVTTHSGNPSEPFSTTFVAAHGWQLMDGNLVFIEIVSEATGQAKMLRAFGAGSWTQVRESAVVN